MTDVDRTASHDVRLKTIRDFWEQRARAFAGADPEGWAAVCHRGAALGVNRFIDWCQHRAVDRLLAHSELPPRAAAADLGCGTGRWARELQRRGFDPQGLDVSPTMVERAAQLSPDIRFGVASITDLPLPDASQGLVAAITVLHHLPPPAQSDAVAEIVRVLRPGGEFLFVVLLDRVPGGEWCYPRSRSGWHGLFEQHGLSAVAETGEEFLTPAILLQLVTGGIVSLVRGPSRPSDPAPGTGTGLMAAVYRRVQTVAVGLSYPLEAAASRWWPGGHASGMAGLWRKP